MHHYFITGTSSGLGKAIAEELLKRKDVHVYGMSRSCTITHKQYTHFTANLADPAQVSKLTELFAIPCSKEDSLYLINNAGLVDPLLHANQYSEANIQQLLQVNLIAAIQLITAFLKIPPTSCKQRVIVSISSGAATKVIDGWSLYGTSKAALDHFSKHVALEMQLQNQTATHVFSIAPGVVDTPMQAKIREASPQGFSSRDRFIELFQNNQLIAPNQVATHYLQILDKPKAYPNCVFSIRDMQK